MRSMLPGILLSGLAILQRRWLTLMRLAWVPAIDILLSVVSQAVLGYLFIVKYGYGIEGIAYAFDISMALQLLIMIIHTSLLSEFREAVFFPRSDTFSGWGEYISISLPAIIVMFTMSFSFELAMVFAGLISTHTQAVYTQVIAIVYTMVYFSSGFLDTLIGIMGNLMGENKPDLAKRVLKTLLYMYLLIFPTIGILLYTFRR